MRASTTCIAILGLALALVMCPWPLKSSVHHDSLFRHSGDGQLNLLNTHTGELFSVVYRDAGGRYNEFALQTVDYALRCHRRGEIHPMSLKLIELVDHLQDNFGAPEISIISGYRSPAHNAALRRRSRRVARHSLHLKGMAVDIRLADVNSRKLGAYARSLRTGGVGTYGNSFVHVDVGRVKSW